jgi:hypothetical protein
MRLNTYQLINPQNQERVQVKAESASHALRAALRGFYGIKTDKLPIHSSGGLGTLALGDDYQPFKDSTGKNVPPIKILNDKSFNFSQDPQTFTDWGEIRL